MMYLSGIVAFAVPCSLNTAGKWNVTKKEMIDEENMKLHDSDESPFKDWGIEENKMVHYHEFCTYNVANHVRAYVDMLYEMRFTELEGLFDEVIKSVEARKDIFMLVYGKLRNSTYFALINEFMFHEFGNSWGSYLNSVASVSSHIAAADEERKEVLLRQAADSIPEDEMNAKSDTNETSVDISRVPEYN